MPPDWRLLHVRRSTGKRLFFEVPFSNGSISPTIDVGNLPSGYALIPGTLIAFKASVNDLGGYTPPATPVPGPLPLAGALAGLGWSRRLRQRLAGLRP
jgi:hypothetical protein